MMLRQPSKVMMNKTSGKKQKMLRQRVTMLKPPERPQAKLQKMMQRRTKEKKPMVKLKTVTMQRRTEEKMPMVKLEVTQKLS